MNKKQIGLSLVLVAFTALTFEAVYEYGYIGFFQVLLSTSAGWTAMVDLVICLTLVLAWMSEDAREKGMSFVPYAIVTLILGSVGPLLYLIVREGKIAVRERSLTRAAA